VQGGIAQLAEPRELRLGRVGLGRHRPIVSNVDPWTVIDRSTIWSYVEGRPGEFSYAREGHPTGEAAEAALGTLDGGHALLFSSGLAAAAGVLLGLLRRGQTVALAGDAYYGVGVLVDDLARWGLARVDFDQTLEPPVGADLVWVEAPSNPLLTFPDLGAATAQAAPVIVDATAAVASSRTGTDIRSVSARRIGAPRGSARTKQPARDATTRTCVTRSSGTPAR
jgi:hypothetical protein